ncbi:Minf_1886 family protein [Candidatus Latescibacterota bacterium]
MISNIEFMKKISDVSESDGRYHKEAFLFVLAGLEYTLAKLDERRHLTGQEFSRGIADYAREQYGYLAKTVLEHWGVTKTDDFGEMVYLLIGISVMSKTEEDKQEDFNDVYDFDTEFVWPKTVPPDFLKNL